MKRLEDNVHIRRIIEVYEAAGYLQTGPEKENYTTINELTDQVPAMRPETLEAAGQALYQLWPVTGNKILSEEDKGAVLAGYFSILAGRPLAMARRYSYELPGALTVGYAMEYGEGTLTVNGVYPGDRITLIDDTLATGGTAIAIAKAAIQMGAEVVEMRVVVEKLGMRGRARIYEELGIDVKAVIGITLNGSGRISVDQLMGQPRLKDY
ncbi:hypothetical protein LCGC14_0809680 [marine sediment metagenome]|uniref:Phosphoribosyltransferase domain-containing protein n=1 Tax=marine sediment metagenome TaxID=412755 RepID=A0A0F9PM58_9ZZZZ